MEYPTTIRIPAQDETFYGRRAGELIYPGAFVRGDGIVKARLHYTEWPELFNDPNMKDGYYFPFWITVPGKKQEVFKNGESKGKAANDGFVVLRVDATQKWEVKLDGESIVKLDFSKCLYDEKGDNAPMFTSFDTGLCGIEQTAYIGSLDKESSTEKVTFERTVPDGFMLTGVILVPSSDFKENEEHKIKVGNSTKPDAYVSEEDVTVTAGKPVRKDLVLVSPSDNTITATAGGAITEGHVDIYVSVIRLQV